MNNGFLTSLNSVETKQIKLLYTLNICEDLRPISQKQSPNNRCFNDSTKCIYFSKCPIIAFSKHVLLLKNIEFLVKK